MEFDLLVDKLLEFIHSIFELFNTHFAVVVGIALNVLFVKLVEDPRDQPAAHLLFAPLAVEAQCLLKLRDTLLQTADDTPSSHWTHAWLLSWVERR